MRFYAHAVPETRQQEIELLLCCARTQITPETREQIHALARPPFDWEYLISSALHHRMIPLVYQAMTKTCPQIVPDSILERLRGHFLANAARNLFLTGHLLKLLDLFQDHGVVAVPLKGPALAEALYGDIALRQFVDLDVLVQRHDAFKAYDLLSSHGFQSVVSLTAEQTKAYSETEYSLNACSNDGEVVVDIHWEMTGRYTAVPFDLPLLEDRLEPATLNGKQISRPSGEDLLVYQCIHGAKDCWTSLDSVCTVAELIRSGPEMDWTYVDRLAHKMQCQRMVSLGLLLAHDLLDAPLPSSIVHRVKTDAKIKGLATEIRKNLFKKDDGTSEESVNRDFSSFHIRVRDRLSDSIRYALSLTFRPSRQEWKYFPLPPAFAFLHYLLRPVRLTLELALALMKRCVVSSPRS